MDKYFRIAKEARLKSDHPTYQIGTVLVNHGKIISVGYNLISKTHSLVRRFHSFQTIHAEVYAIIHSRFKHNLKGAVMYIYRETKDGRTALARPCSVCRKIMTTFGIKEIVYTTDTGWIKERL